MNSTICSYGSPFLCTLVVNPSVPCYILPVNMILTLRRLFYHQLLGSSTTYFLGSSFDTHWPSVSESESKSHFTADSQSVCFGVELTLWTSDKILLPFQVFRCGIFCLVSVGRPLWRKAGFVLCKSQPSHLSCNGSHADLSRPLLT
jgi:hypothetical protein